MFEVGNSLNSVFRSAGWTWTPESGEFALKPRAIDFLHNKLYTD